MSTSRNPAKSRPLSANVKRLMRLARASPQNNQVIKVARQFTARDLAYKWTVICSSDTWNSVTPQSAT